MHISQTEARKWERIGQNHEYHAVSRFNRWETDDTELITRSYLYNFDPLKPNFYIVKLGFTRIYVIFLISARNIDCGYSLEPPHRNNLCFEQKYEKILDFLSENFHFLVENFSVCFNRHVFVMYIRYTSRKHAYMILTPIMILFPTFIE